MVTIEKVYVIPVEEEETAQQYAPLLEQHYESSGYQGNSPTGIFHVTINS
jgi:hypothetical protein